MSRLASRRALWAINLAVLATASLIAVGAAFAQPGDTAVTIKNFDFHPMAVSVPVGATVTWKNLDGEPHTVTSTNGSFRSEALDEDDTFTFRFTTPGVYKYLCTIHPKMVATVTVNDPCAVLPCPSFAVHATVVVPIANVLPLAGVQVTAGWSTVSSTALTV